MLVTSPLHPTTRPAVWNHLILTRHRRGVTLAPLDPPRVGRRFVTLYALSYAGGSLLFLGPLLVSLALKVNDLVGIDDAPKNLALVTGVGSLLAIVSNPLFGRLSDRTTSALGMRRPWMIVGLVGGAVGTLTVALAPSIGVVLVGWCIAQVFLNALLAAQAAILPDQVPTVQRGLVSGILGRLPPSGLGGRHLPRPGLRGTPADDVPRAAVGRGRARRHLHQLPPRPPARRGRQAAMVAEAAASGRSTSAPGPTPTSPGPSPVGSCWSWRTPSWSPTRPTT